MVCRSHLGGQQIQGYLKSSKVLGAGVETIHVPQQLASYSGQPHPSLGAQAYPLCYCQAPCQGKWLCSPPLYGDRNSVEFLLP